MTGVLLRIKRAALEGRVRFTWKAELEMESEGLNKGDVLQSLYSAVAVYKTIRSTSPYRSAQREMLHVIISPNWTGVPIYTKGKFAKSTGQEIYYLLVSSKKAIRTA